MRGGLAKSVSDVHVRGADVSHHAHVERVVEVLVLHGDVFHRHRRRGCRDRIVVADAERVGLALDETQRATI